MGPKKIFTIQRCSPKRGDICSCTHDAVPAIQCTHIKTGTHQVAEQFSMTVFLWANTGVVERGVLFLAAVE